MTAGWLHLADQAATAVALVLMVAGLLILNVTSAIAVKSPGRWQAVGAVLFVTPSVVRFGRDLLDDLIHGPAWLRLLIFVTVALWAAALSVGRLGGSPRRRKWLGTAALLSMSGSFVADLCLRGSRSDLLDVAAMLLWIGLIFVALTPLVWVCQRIMRRRDAVLRGAVAGLVHPVGAGSR